MQDFARWARGVSGAGGSVDQPRHRSRNSFWVLALAWDIIRLGLEIPQIVVDALRHGEQDEADLGNQWLRDHPGEREAWVAEAHARYLVAHTLPDYPPVLYHTCGPPGCEVVRQWAMSAEALAREAEYEQRHRSTPLAVP